jgi:hypothetical protein
MKFLYPSLDIHVSLYEWLGQQHLTAGYRSGRVKPFLQAKATFRFVTSIAEQSRANP